MSKQDLKDYIQKIEYLRKNPNTSVEVIGETSQRIKKRKCTYPIYKVTLGTDQKPRITLAGGVHGDEISGIKTILNILSMSELPKHMVIEAFTMVNPVGVLTGEKEIKGTDPNTQFGYGTLDINRLIEHNVNRSTAFIDFHECVYNEGGFCIFELNYEGKPVLGRLIINKIKKHTRILSNGDFGGTEEYLDDNGVTYGFTKNGIAFDEYMLRETRTPYCLTTEPSNGLPLEERVKLNLIAFDVTKRFILSKKHLYL